MDTIFVWLQEPLFYRRASVVVAFALIVSVAARAGLPLWTTGACALVGYLGGYVGSALFNTLVSSEATPIYGLSSIGGIIGAITISSVFLKSLRADPLRFADAALPGVAVGYALWRLGCFFNGCCHGVPTDMPWGATHGPQTGAFTFQVIHRIITPSTPASLPVHPTQLYEAALALFVLFVVTRTGGDPPGRRTALLLSIYGGGRFMVEFLRASYTAPIGPLYPNQIGSLAILMSGLILLTVTGQSTSHSRRIAVAPRDGDSR